jgi:tetratricopeptide (TPR) repeat protein
MLIDDGLLRRDDGHWIPTKDLAQVQIPPTIQALLAARLDRLDREERSVVESGSVEGKVFHRGAVKELAPPHAREGLATHLMALTRRDLIGPDRAEIAGEEAYRFRHQLIRDAAYAGMPKERRADLHRRFAAWLERAAGASVQEYEEILGYHLEQACRYRAELGPPTSEDQETAQRASKHLSDAGRRALLRGDLPAAAKLLERARAILPEDDPERLWLVLTLSSALRGIGDLVRARRLLGDAAARAAAAGDPVLEMHLRIEELEFIGLTDPDSFSRRVGPLHRQAVELFERVGDHRGLAKTWIMESWRLNQFGHPPEMEEALQRAIEHARLAGDRELELESTASLGMDLYWGRTPAGPGIAREEAILRDLTGHPWHQLRVKRSLAGFIGMQGRFEEARALLREVRAGMEELGMEIGLATAGFIEGPLEMWAGDPVAAELALRRSCEALQRMGEKTWLCSLAAFLGEALYVQGKYDEAENWTRVAEEAAGREDMEAQADYRCVRAKVLARRGQLDQARRLMDEALEFEAQTGELDHNGDAHMDVGEVLTLAGDREGAAAAYRKALGFYEAKGNLVMADKARSVLAEMGWRPDLA